MLQSPKGLEVLHDIIALYRKSSNVEYRPGLERDKCSCKRSDNSSCEEDNNNSAYDWRHIYTYHKAGLKEVYSFAELYFLCYKWFYGT